MTFIFWVHFINFWVTVVVSTLCSYLCCMIFTCAVLLGNSCRFLHEVFTNGKVVANFCYFCIILYELGSNVSNSYLCWPLCRKGSALILHYTCLVKWYLCWLNIQHNRPSNARSCLCHIATLCLPGQCLLVFTLWFCNIVIFLMSVLSDYLGPSVF